MRKPLKFEQEERVVTLTLDDPKTRNSLYGDDLYDAFEQAVDSINADLGVSVAILTGRGSVFCSGGNLKEMRDRKGMFGGKASQLPAQYRRGIQRIPRSLFQLDVPLIAAEVGYFCP